MARLKINYEAETLTEHEVNVIKQRLNHGKVKQTEIFGSAFDAPKLLMRDHTKKGIDFLLNLWKTPTGRLRKNNPFGYREQAILENFDHFELGQYVDTANYYQVKSDYHFYQPLYTVVAEDGASFEYYYHGGEVHITG